MRNKEKNDYITLPFPRLNGKTHPALVELRRQAELLSLMPYGLDRGVGPYGSALLIDRDMKMRPYAYPGESPAGLWFPPSSAHMHDKNIQVAQPQASATNEERIQERINEAARAVASKWSRNDDE
jgi:hypothetical protein